MKNVALVMAGVVAGALAGVFGTRTYYKKKYEEKYDKDIREYYAAFSKENFKENLVETPETTTSDKKEESTDVKQESKTEMRHRPSTLEQYSEMAHNYAPQVDYWKLARERKQAAHVDPAEMESPTDDDGEDEVTITLLEEDDHDVGIAPLNKDAWESATPHYEKVEITYYEKDDIYYNEDTAMEVDPMDTCGKGVLNRFGEEVEDEAYSRNYNTDTDYCVYRCKANYSDRE